LEEILAEMQRSPVKKKSKQALLPGQKLFVAVNNREDTESQQRKVLDSAYIIANT